MDRRQKSMTNHPDINDPNVFFFYRYDPSLIAAAISMICFSVTTCVHIFQASKYRTYYFIPFIIGGLFDIVGYIGRALAHYNAYSLSFYLVQEFLLLLAPTLFTASIYMTLGRIILVTQGERMSPIPANWLTKIFLFGDMLSFAVQAGGGALMATKNMALGERIAIIGLLIQTISFCFFVVTGGIFHFNIRQSLDHVSLRIDWQKYIFTLYAASILIFLRSIFRVVEFSGGNDGFLMRHEVFVYIFEGVMMLGVMLSFNIIHPGRLSRRPLQELIILRGRDTNFSESKTSLNGSDKV